MNLKNEGQGSKGGNSDIHDTKDRRVFYGWHYSQAKRNY